jgi:prepilin peptidase CpaA
LASGRTELFIAAIAALSAVAAITDLVRGRIYNWLTVPAFLAGIAYSAHLSGWNGALQAVLGAATGLLLYGWMFAIRMIGGGDVKLLQGAHQFRILISRMTVLA